MKKHKLLTKPTRLEDLSFDDMDEADAAELRVERQNTRQWRKLKHQLV